MSAALRASINDKLPPSSLRNCVGVVAKSGNQASAIAKVCRGDTSFTTPTTSYAILSKVMRLPTALVPGKSARASFRNYGHICATLVLLLRERPAFEKFELQNLPVIGISATRDRFYPDVIDETHGRRGGEASTRGAGKCADKFRCLRRQYYILDETIAGRPEAAASTALVVRLRNRKAVDDGKQSLLRSGLRIDKAIDETRDEHQHH